MSSKIFYIWQALLAGATSAVSGGLLTGLIGSHAAGAIGLVVGAAGTSTATYAALSGSKLAVQASVPTIVHETIKQVAPDIGPVNPQEG